MGTKPRLPNSLLGALLRKFWPGHYTLPLGDRKLATTWADYQAAPVPGFTTAAEAVITKFWVRHISRFPFIVDDPTVLTHDSHNCFMHDYSAFIVWMRRNRGRRTGLCLGLVSS